MSYHILKPDCCHPVRGVLFDMDGVVLDSECLYTRFWQEAAQDAGYAMTRKQALGLRSLNRLHGEAYLKSCFGPDIDYQAIRSLRISKMDSWISGHGISAKPGIQELLDYLRDHCIPCAITSSSPPDRIAAYLKPLGLYDQFAALCSGYQLPHGKPDPDIYLFGAQQLGLPAVDCLALEDSAAGITSAFRADCLPVIIPDQDQPSEDTLLQSFAKADSLADICALLDELNRL